MACLKGLRSALTHSVIISLIVFCKNMNQHIINNLMILITLPVQRYTDQQQQNHHAVLMNGQTPSLWYHRKDNVEYRGQPQLIERKENKYYNY